MKTLPVKKDFVGAGFDEGLADVAAALKDGDEIGRKAGVEEELLDEGAALGSEVGGLAEDGVAGSDGSGDLGDGDGEGIVPGRDDGEDAEGFVDEEAGLGAGGSGVVRDFFGAEERFGVSGEIGGGIEGDEDVGEESFNARLAGFADDGVGEKFGALEEKGLQRAEEGAAVGYGGAGPGELRGAGFGEERRDGEGRSAGDFGEDAVGGGVDGRESFDGERSGEHGEILAERGERRADSL